MGLWEQRRKLANYHEQSAAYDHDAASEPDRDSRTDSYIQCEGVWSGLALVSVVEEWDGH